MIRSLIFLAALAAIAPAAPDTVDTTFASTAGQVFTPNHYGGVASLLVQPDGRILFGSNEIPGTVGGNPLRLPLIRFNPDGSVDNTFFADNEPNGSDGGIYYDGQGWSEVHSLGLLSDGKIVAAGVMQGVRTGTVSSPGTFLQSNSIVRFNADGTIDTSFQTAGTIGWPTGGLNFIDEVTIQPDDKIIAVGGFGGFRDSLALPSVARHGIARLNVDGSLDTSFQINPSEFGVPTGASLVRGWFQQASLDASGRVLVVGGFEWGPSFPPAGSVEVLARLNPDGSRDTSFSPVLPADLAGFRNVVVEPSGRITVVASRTNDQTWMGRFLPDGTPDATFVLDPSLTTFSARPLRVDAAGRYLVATRSASGAYDRLVRILPDGSLDTAFEALATYVNGPSGSGPGYFGTFDTAPSGKIYSGSFFDRVNGEETVKLVAFEGDYSPSATGQIRLAATAVSAAEQDGMIRVAVTRDGGVAGIATVQFATSPGTANSTDFTLTAGTLTWPAGTGGSQFIEIPITQDSIAEGSEPFTLVLSNATGATISGASVATATIIDSNSPPIITRQPQTLFVPPGSPFTLNVGVVSGAGPVTYQWFKNGNLLSGATAPVYSIPSADAAAHNGNYTVTVTNPNGSTPSAAAGVTVKNPAILGFTSPTATAVENDGTLTLTLQRAGSNVGAVSVDVSLVDGTATSPADFTAATTTVSWADGDTADKTIAITLTNDAAAESPETFQVILENLSLDAIFGGATTVVTLLDDDSGPAITTPLASMRAVTGWNAAFSVGVQSQTTVSYEWFKDGESLPGETGATLSFEPVTLADFGYYSVEATNTAGTVTSGPVELGARPNPLDRVALDLSVSSNQFSGISARPAGGYLIYGAFTSVPTSGGTVSISRVMRTHPDGSLDTTFSPAPNSTVTHALELSDGSTILGGGFSQIGVVSVSGPLVKLLPDGSVDPDFSSNLPAGIGSLRDLEIGPDGRIYVTHADGIDRLNLDGTYDAAFRANVIAPFEPFATYNNLEFGPGGEFYLAGRVQLPGVGYRNLVKLNSNGTLDPTWKFTYGNSTFSNIGIQPDGKLIVPGSSSSTVIRLLPDGSTDAGFTPITGVWSQTFGVAADGSVYIASGNNSNAKLRHFLPDGTLDSAFNGGIDPAANNTISSITPLPDGSIAIHGSFTTFNGASADRPYLLTAQKQGIIITSQPLSQAVDPGDDVSLQVVATSVTPLTYQWSKNGSPLPGETLPTLQLDAVDTSDTAGYSVKVTAGPLSATSETASLTVRDEPVVLATPDDLTLLLGNPLELTIDWVGLTPATFEWFRNGSPVGGQDTATLSIPSPTAGDSGLYTLRITNSLGHTTSHPVVVNIVPDPAAIAAGYVPATAGSPQVSGITPAPDGAYVHHEFSTITHPSGTYNSVLERIDLNGNIAEPFASTPNTNLNRVYRDASTGDLYLYGQSLFLDGIPSLSLARIAADGTVDTAFTAAATAALNSIGVNPFGVGLDADGRVLVGGITHLVRLNSDGTLHANLSSAVSDLSFIHQMEIVEDGKILLVANQGMRRVLPDGTIDPTFTMPALGVGASFSQFELEPNGNIILPFGGFTGQAIFRLSPEGSLLETLDFPYSTYGTLHQLKVTPSGKFLIAHSTGTKLTRLNPDGTPDPQFSLTTGFGNSLSTIALGPDGSYWAGGSFTTFEGANVRGLVRLNGEPLDVVISTQPTPQITDAGETAAFSVSATASGGATLSYLWRRDGVPLENGGKISGATTATLTITDSQDADEGSYDVIVTNTVTGRPYLSNPVNLTVLREPEFLVTPAAQNLEVGDSLTLSIEARGAGTLGYQWLRNGDPIFGENAATLTISPAKEQDSGTYTVEISNAYGTFSSIDIPVVVTLPAGGIRYTTPQLTFGSTVAAVLPLPDGRTLVGGYFTNVIANSTNHNISELALLDVDGNLVTTFDLNPSSSVDALALMPDGGVLVGGNFTFIGGVSRNRIARLNPDLTLDTDWTADAGANNRINVIEPAPTGYYVGGSFTSFNGDTLLAHLCRILPDGSPDPGFLPHAPLGIIYDLQRDGDGVLAGGNMTVANADTANNQIGIVRLHGDGSHDTGFVSTMAFGTTVYSIAALPDGKWLAGGTSGRLQRFLPDGTTDSTWLASANQTIRSIAVQPDGLIVIGGNFTTLAGTSVNRIGRLFPNGSPDASFAQGAGADGEINVIARDALGGLHIGGSFNNYRSQQRGRYARLNGTPVSIGIAIQPVAQIVNPGDTAQFSITAVATETISYQWRKNGTPLSNGGDFSGVTTATLTIANVEDTDEAGYDVVVTHNGDATAITSASAELVVLGAPEILTPPAAVTTEAGLSATFRVNARGVAPLTYQWYRGNTLLSDETGIAGTSTAELVLSGLAVADSGDIKVRVTNPLGFDESSPVALLVEKLPAARDRSIVLPVNVNTTINDVIPFADGSYLIGGNFTSVSHTTGSASRRYLARFHADGSLDSDIPQISGSGTVEILALAPDGKIYIGGGFTTLSTPGGNISRTRIARLNSDLSLDTTFAVEGTGPNSAVKCILPLANGKVLIGGQFNNINSLAGTGYLALLNSDGSVDTGFTSLATTTVNDIAPAGDGTYWLSHSNSYGGQMRIVRIDATGAVASGFSYTSNISSDRVSPQPDGTVLSIASYAVQKLEASGTIVNGWGGGGTYLGVSNPSAITTHTDGTIYLGGNFTGINSVTRNRLAALDSDGSIIDAFDPGDGPNGPTSRIRIDAAGRVWVVGSFTTYRGESVPYMVVLNGLGDGTSDPFNTFVATLPPGEQGENDDPDGDGFPNLIEFLFGTDPGNGGTTPTPVSTGSAQTGAALNATYSLSLDPGKTYRLVEIEIPTDLMGLDVDLEASQDLGFSGDATATEIGVPTDNGSTETRRYVITPALEDAPAMFWRLTATR